jgi:hypothetical protein
VDPGVTSVQVTQQTARSPVAGTVTIRDIDATSNKPEVGSTLNIVNVPLKQVAGAQTGVERLPRAARRRDRDRERPAAQRV